MRGTNFARSAVRRVRLKLRSWRGAEPLSPKPLTETLVARFCLGSGIEIGAGKTPRCPRERTLFLDKNIGDKDATENADIISDASKIPLPDESMDFVFSSHVLEHMQNTIATLNEWMRVLRPGGVIFLILPHAQRTIDRCRQLTSLEHHIADERLGDEPDRTHFEEMKAGWIAAGVADAETYQREWGADIWDWEFRIAHGVLHFHVWTQSEIVRLLQYLGQTMIVYVEERVPERDDSFIVVARKIA